MGFPLPDDPEYRAAIADLLGMLALGELAAFSRLAADAEMAPAIEDREAFARLALTEFTHYELLAARVREFGCEPAAVMSPYAEGFAAFHERTRPSTWLEAVVKAFVGDGIAADFAREIAEFVDGDSRSVIHATVAHEERSTVLLDLARRGMAADAHVSGRLALWGRRLHGEAITQAQVVAAQRESLAALLTDQFGGPGLDLARLGELFARLADRHTDRMALLGLTA